MKNVGEYTGLGRNRADLRHIIYSHRLPLRLVMSGNFCWRITPVSATQSGVSKMNALLLG